MSTTYSTLISVAQLQALMQSPRQQGSPLPVLIDCSFDLTDPAKGERQYHQGHPPGAFYAHLDRDLSGPPHPAGPRSPLFTGRHPLPDRTRLAAWAGNLGIAPGRQVVTFDADGSPFAARAWWLLRWLGHEAVAVLDGGSAAWKAAAGAWVKEVIAPPGGPAYPADKHNPASMNTIDAPALQAALASFCIIDARAAERYRGDVEPLDPVGGHIPGASQRFFKDNLRPDGHFKSPEELRSAFLALGAGGERPVVHQCGSGVTACHNLLAMTHAGLTTSTLYPGSWSEWCADPARPVAKG